jgi:hypothetical protein
MMSRTRRVALCAIAVALPCAGMSAGAQAAPGSLEFGKCAAKEGGMYTNGACTKKPKMGAGKFEWTPLTSGVASKGAKEKATGRVTLGSTSCAGMTQSEGEYGPASKEERNIAWAFSGCEQAGVVCSTEGAKAGEIVWKKLRGVPGVIKQNAKEEANVVGVAFSAQSGATVAEFSCGPVPTVVKGGVIVAAEEDAKLSDNKMANKYELEFIAEKGKQVPEKFFGEPKLVLESLTAEELPLTMVYVQETNPKTAKVELRQCEANVC